MIDRQSIENLYSDNIEYFSLGHIEQDIERIFILSDSRDLNLNQNFYFFIVYLKRQIMPCISSLYTDRIHRNMEKVAENLANNLARATAYYLNKLSIDVNKDVVSKSIMKIINSFLIATPGEIYNASWYFSYDFEMFVDKYSITIEKNRYYIDLYSILDKIRKDKDTYDYATDLVSYIFLSYIILKYVDILPPYINNNIFLAGDIK